MTKDIIMRVQVKALSVSGDIALAKAGFLRMDPIRAPRQAFGLRSTIRFALPCERSTAPGSTTRTPTVTPTTDLT